MVIEIKVALGRLALGRLALGMSVIGYTAGFVLRMSVIGYAAGFEYRTCPLSKSSRVSYNGHAECEAARRARRAAAGQLPVWLGRLALGWYGWL